MRGAIIITVIVVGGLLVVAPLVAEYMTNSSHEANLVRLLEKPGVNNVNLKFNPIPTGAEVVCAAVGIVVLVVGLVLAVRVAWPARPGRPARIEDDLPG